MHEFFADHNIRHFHKVTLKVTTFTLQNSPLASFAAYGKKFIVFKQCVIVFAKVRL